MRFDDLTAFIQSENTTMVGKRVDDHGSVLAGFYKLIEVANRPVPHSQGQRPIVPHGSLRIEQEAADEVGCSHVLVAGHRNQRPF